MEFSPANPIVKLCIQGMAMEDNGQPGEAKKLFLQAWDDATTDFEKFTAAYYVARHQNTTTDKLNWLETTLSLALQINDDSVYAAIPSLYKKIAECYDELNDAVNSKKNYDSANALKDKISDKGPFYHGTKADLNNGDLLVPGNESNYKAELMMNHIYFTAMANGAGLAAALAKGDGRERVYIVEPTGSFENDPNVTDKKFPGNPTRSYRTALPLKIVGEVTEWNRMPGDELKKWKERLANNKGEIIN